MKNEVTASDNRSLYKIVIFLTLRGPKIYLDVSKDWKFKKILTVKKTRKKCFDSMRSNVTNNMTKVL